MNKTLTTRDIVYISLFAALISVSSYITIPIPPVPVTAQTLVIMLAGCLLTTTQSALSVTVFLFLGAIGVPVFSKGSAGIQVIIGPTGGYLIGFLVGVIVISILKGKNNSLLRYSFANLVGGIIVVYIFGVLWLSFSTGMTPLQAFTVGALKFIPADIAKLIIASLIAKQIYHRIPR